jgi:NAD-dependent deacetylase
MSQDSITLAAERLSTATRGVAFTGAGISTESGIADFRSPGGIWARYRPVYFDEFLASHEARKRMWTMKKEMHQELAAARPNAGHLALAAFERAGKLIALITQNIDGLHGDAGSRNVLEIHGTGRFVTCLSCHKRWPSNAIFEQYKGDDNVPVCDECKGWLKPATVSFGQAMPEELMREAERLSVESDIFLAIGSSLVVQPAAWLPEIAARSGSFLVIINRDPTPLDDVASIIIREPIGQTLRAIAERIGIPDGMMNARSATGI